MAHSTLFLDLPVTDLDAVVDAVGERWQALRGKRLLLTGGTGFIGKWLLATFLHANQRLDLGATVLVLSRQPEAFLQQFPALRSRGEVEWIACDVRHLAPEMAPDCTFAIHAATDVVAAASAADVLHTCIAGTERVLAALGSGSQRKRALLLSSGAVYGRPDATPMDEDCPRAPSSLSPASAYGEGKRVSELLCAMASAAQPSLEVAIARCFAFVGPHLPLDKHFAIGNFISAAMKGKDIDIQGDGTPLRSYLYAADLAHWLWVMLFEAPNCRAYNVGGAESLSIRDLAYRVNQTLGGQGSVRIAQTPPAGAVPQAYLPDLTRIEKELGLVPRVSLDDAIRRTAQWARQNSEE